MCGHGRKLVGQLACQSASDGNLFCEYLAVAGRQPRGGQVGLRPWEARGDSPTVLRDRPSRSYLCVE